VYSCVILKLHRRIGLLQSGKERRNWFTSLEVDGAFLDLHDDVGGEFAVERWKMS
jgi:hypothetical protein